MGFEFKLRKQGTVQVVSFKGRITTENDVENLKIALESQAPNFVFDLSELDHVNSSGINFIIKSLTRCRVAGGELVLTGLKGSVKQLFELAKIDGLFTTYDNQEDSIKHFNTKQ
jgi:anti-sigma B factor antagonist